MAKKLLYGSSPILVDYATSDSNGRNIVNTYLKKADIDPRNSGTLTLRNKSTIYGSFHANSSENVNVNIPKYSDLGEYTNTQNFLVRGTWKSITLRASSSTGTLFKSKTMEETYTTIYFSTLSDYTKFIEGEIYIKVVDTSSSTYIYIRVLKITSNYMECLYSCPLLPADISFGENSSAELSFSSFVLEGYFKEE